jgi:hypothetical protein
MMPLPALLCGVHGAPVPDLPVDRIVLEDIVVYGVPANRTGREELIASVAVPSSSSSDRTYISEGGCRKRTC